MEILKIFLMLSGLFLTPSAFGEEPSPVASKIETRPGLWIHAASADPELDLEFRTTAGRILVSSLRQDLLHRVEAGEIDEMQMQTILTELLVLKDSVYIVPSTLVDLGKALGVPVDGL